MKRTIIPFIIGLCLFAVQVKAQIPSDSSSYKISADSIPNRQDPNNPDPDPDDPPGLIWGDTFDPAFSVGTKSADFTYSDTRNTNNFTNQYNGCSTNDVFYVFTLTVPMNVTITHQGSPLNDTYLSLLASDLSLIESNNDYSGDGHCTNTSHAFIQRQLSAGTYYVVSEGYYSNGKITTNITGNTCGSFNYPSIPSTYSTEPGNSVGAMGGAFGVSPMGGATYSIPIEVPQGVGGLQPQLAIVYNSQAGNGLCGYGASLSGLSSITRAPKDIYHDTIAQGMKYLAGDALYLDGVRLILSSGTAGQEGAVYNPESDPFTSVITHGTCTSTSNNIWFEVQSSDGMIYRYGYNPDSNTETHSKLSYTVNGVQKIHSWYLSYVLQPTGNYMSYTYLIEDNCVYPSQISYGKNIGQGNSSTLNNLIEFGYNQSRADSIPIVFDGKRGSMKRRLQTITGKTGNNIYRTYTLNYNTTGDVTAYKFSRLESVTERNAQNQQLPATKLNWSYLPQTSYLSNSITITNNVWTCSNCHNQTSIRPEQCSNCGGHEFALSNPQSGTSIPFSDQSFCSGDMNNDGIPEIVGIGSSGNNTMATIYYGQRIDNSTIHCRSLENYALPNNERFLCIDTYREANFITDINGDGFNELIVPYYDGVENDEVSVAIYVIGQGFQCELKTLDLDRPYQPLICTGDPYNDGKNRVLILETDPYIQGYALHILKYNDQFVAGGNNDVLVYSSLQHLSFSSKPRQMYLSDMNGDGLQDLFVLCNDGYKIFWNQGNSIFTMITPKTGNDPKYQSLHTAGDFNGDGYLDILSYVASPNNQTCIWKYYINNGDGTFQEKQACTLSFDSNQYPFINGDLFEPHCEVLDFDYDGMDDVIITMPTYHYYYNNRVFSLNHTYWMRSTGTALVQEYHATSVRPDDALSGKYIIGDFDGDGRTELVNYGYDCAHGNNSNTNPVWKIYKNSSLTLQSGKVTSITGDMGANTSITYSTLAIPGVYTLGVTDVYPAPKYTIPLNVVRQTIQSNGAAGNMTTTYSYSGLKVHLQGKGILGFTSTTANNSTLGTSTTSSVEAWNSTFHIPSSTKVRTTIGNVYSETTTTLNITDKGDKKYFAYPSQTVERDFDGFTATTTRNYNVGGGYIMSERTDYGTNMYRSISYEKDTILGGRHLPRKVVTSQRHPDDNSAFSNTTTYIYNSQGLVKRKTENQNSADSLATCYNYDPWGNIANQQSIGNGVTQCITYYTYDDTHRFPLRVYTYPASSVHKYTYDPWGNILTELDSMNTSRTDTISKNTYDGWGNLVRTEIPGRGEVTYTRGWNNDAGKQYFILTQGTARPWVKTWYDNQGREVYTESKGPDNVNMVSYVTYNSKGLVTERSSTTGNLGTGRSYEYDSRGRITREMGPANFNVTYSYGTQNDTKTVEINDNGRTTICTYDLWDNLKTETAPVSAITNTYYSHGGIKTTQSGGATWTFGYDQRGNRTSMTDPDAGTTTYVYDALGRERSRTDARNIANVTNYDYLGRVTSSASVTYTYGTSGTDQMRLKSKSYGGWTETYEYDAYGNITHETMSNGTDITRHRYYTYNANGQLTGRTLPGNMTYGYTYDAYGNLTGVNGAGGAVQWSLAEYTGRRTVSQTVLNGYSSYPFSTTHLLDQYGYLDSIKTSQNGGYYQLEDYNFYPITGNLTSANNRMTDGETWTFVYDIADRLTKVRENNQDIMEMTYAANGNITSKTGIGSYIYNHSKPHAVDTVSNTLGKLPGGDMYVTYNNWGKMSSVWYNGPTDFYSYSVSYGPDMQRVTSEMHKTYQKQYDKFYWDDYEEKVMGTDTLHYYYVYGADGLAGLHIVKTGPNIQTTTHTTKVITDHLGSIVSLIDVSDWVYDVQYDVWGGRNVMLPYDFDPTFDRGYTGHEHIDVLNLINMNGRMYDPQLGRFLSPDPFIQSPTNPQNFNRYSYCLNNPLKYTDPDGESWLIAGIVAFMLLTEEGYNIQKAISPIAIHLDVHLGTQQLGLGYDVSIGRPTIFPISYRRHYGETYYWKTYGNNSGWEYREGGEWGFQGLLLGFPYFINYSGTIFSGINSQTTNSVSLSKLPFMRTTYENDTELFVKLPGVPKYDNYDRYRTAAVSIKRGPFTLQTNLHTGMPDNENPNDGDGTEENPYHFSGGDIDKQHHGILSLGFGPFRIGWDSEKIRHTFQNRMAHDHLWKYNYGKVYPWVLDNGQDDSFFFYLGSGAGNTMW